MSLDLRPYVPGDEDAILRLSAAAVGQAMPADQWRWRFLHNSAVPDAPDITIVDVSVDADAIEAALRDALRHAGRQPDHTYGDGHAAERIAASLTELVIDATLLRKEMAFDS